jgi:hypothetical protein
MVRRSYTNSAVLYLTWSLIILQIPLRAWMSQVVPWAIPPDRLCHLPKIPLHWATLLVSLPLWSLGPLASGKVLPSPVPSVRLSCSHRLLFLFFGGNVFGIWLTNLLVDPPMPYYSSFATVSVAPYPTTIPDLQGARVSYNTNPTGAASTPYIISTGYITPPAYGTGYLSLSSAAPYPTESGIYMSNILGSSNHPAA